MLTKDNINKINNFYNNTNKYKKKKNEKALAKSIINNINDVKTDITDVFYTLKNEEIALYQEILKLIK